MQASYPAIGSAKKSLLEALTEVHLRRLDTDDTLHRRAVAVIAIEATPEEVDPFIIFPYFNCDFNRKMAIHRQLGSLVAWLMCR